MPCSESGRRSAGRADSAEASDMGDDEDDDEDDDDGEDEDEDPSSPLRIDLVPMASVRASSATRSRTPCSTKRRPR